MMVYDITDDSSQEQNWIWSAYFIRGRKSDGSTSPNFVPSIFNHISFPLKRKADCSVVQYKRREVTKNNRIESIVSQEASKALLFVQAS